MAANVLHAIPEKGPLHPRWPFLFQRMAVVDRVLSIPTNENELCE